MNDFLEKKLRELLPYIIVEGVIFLLMPLFMGTGAGVLTYIILLGVFPLTSIGCCVHYVLYKKKRDLAVCAVAPLFYALTALLYGMWRDSWYTVLIYLAAYFLCGYLGIMLSDILLSRRREKPTQPMPAAEHAARRPRRVNVKKEEPAPEDFQAQDPDEDVSLDASTTDDDIEAILNEIHNRRS